MIDEEKYLLLQKKLATQIIIPSENEGFIAEPQSVILSLDVQYENDKAFVAGDLQTFDNQFLNTYTFITSYYFPYIPSLFCFREAPILCTFIEEILKNKEIPKPDVIIIDGHGTAHPRNFGVACCVGLLMNIPTLGCAKDTLIRYEGNLGNNKNEILAIQDDEKSIIGYAWRSQTNIKPMYISAGYQISQEESLTIIQQVTSMYRNPEPLRRADMTARKLQKQNFDNTYIFLGETQTPYDFWEKYINP